MTRKTTIIVAGQKIDYILRSGEPGLLPTPRSLGNPSPERSGQPAPGFSYPQGHAERQAKPDHLRASSSRARLSPQPGKPVSPGRTAGRVLLLPISTIASLSREWLIRGERTAHSQAPALCSTRRRPSNLMPRRPASRQLQPAAGCSRRQAVAEPGPEPRAAARRTRAAEHGEHGEDPPFPRRPTPGLEPAPLRGGNAGPGGVAFEGCDD